jgi:acyl-coenzyme A thioesterase PaaI-like protein
MTEREQRDRLADAVRRLIDHAVNSDVPEDEVEEIIATLEQIDAQLKQHPRRATFKTKAPDFADLQAIFRNDPIIGLHNPIAPPVMVEKDGEVIRGRATLGSAYEGPPGYVHGAVLAGVFDMLLGLANVASGSPGMTGTLTVKFRRPTPLNTPLIFEAFTDRIDGRKVIAKGTLHAGEELTAEAEGVFVSLQIDRAVEYFRDGRRV